ncbi:hypothetical protein J1605_008211 [Eschrichtius robustus]|uniref:Uncharacterized protein n=1 Tax=Eschrichtius robustus TaxID=9764 RepID=A0AB34GYP8_ESCRO|nr:hypothetical protein J1605_008211 [Eschrichtius robustus]
MPRSNWAREPQLLSLRVWSLCSATREAAMKFIPQMDNKICDRLEESVASKKYPNWESLVVQWLRIRLPMQGTRVQALVREDPTCHGATKPVLHNY